MVLFDRKKALTQIMGPPPEKKSEEENMGQPEHLSALAKESIDSIHAKDPEGFLNAQRAIHMHFAGENDPIGEDAGE